MEGYKKTSTVMAMIALLAMLALPAFAARPRYLPHPAGHFPARPVPQAELAEPEVSQAEEFDPIGYAFGIVDGAFELADDILESIFVCERPSGG
ncbi:MAG: hypothetical protein FVQ79_04955 [Planctomycetes bacterium]|nr:hypothetical protein [Planctomycetota bacterium]